MIGERLQILFDKLIETGVISSKKDFSDALGIDYGSLSKYFNNKVNLSINNLNYSNYKKLGINIDWLLTGEGEMFKTGTSIVAEKKSGIEERIPILSQKVSCGPGQVWEHEDNIVEYLDVRALSPVLHSRNVYGFRAIGTSMLGAGIRDGDIVLFNADKDSPVTDGIYVFGLDGDTYCKRLEFDRLANRIKIFSVRVADLEKAELLKTLDSTDEGFNERFRLFGKVFSWIHVINGEIEQ